MIDVEYCCHDQTYIAHVALRLVQLLNFDELDAVNPLGVQDIITTPSLEFDGVTIEVEEGDTVPTELHVLTVLLTLEEDGAASHGSVIPLAMDEFTLDTGVGGDDEVVDSGVHDSP